jgi:hypothetical protein
LGLDFENGRTNSPGNGVWFADIKDFCPAFGEMKAAKMLALIAYNLCIRSGRDRKESIEGTS